MSVESNSKYYYDNISAFMDKYMWQYIIIKEHKLFGAYDTKKEAYSVFESQLPIHHCSLHYCDPKDLTEKYLNKTLVIINKKIVEVYETYLDAVRATRAKYQEGTYKLVSCEYESCVSGWID